jgi:hypothetical protein
MRRLWALTLAPLLALAFVLLGSGPANAFGSEVLGCSVDGSTWIAGSCAGGAGDGPGVTSIIEFAPHNLSGTYTYAWTVKTQSGIVVSGKCGTTSGLPCVYAGCTSTSSSCDIKVDGGALHDRTYSASLRLTQAGLSRTITASATIWGANGCLNC